jgi:hypothetical protein
MHKRSFVAFGLSVIKSAIPFHEDETLIPELRAQFNKGFPRPRFAACTYARMAQPDPGSVAGAPGRGHDDGRGPQQNQEWVDASAAFFPAGGLVTI